MIVVHVRADFALSNSEARFHAGACAFCFCSGFSGAWSQASFPLLIIVSFVFSLLKNVMGTTKGHVEMMVRMTDGQRKEKNHPEGRKARGKKMQTVIHSPHEWLEAM